METTIHSKDYAEKRIKELKEKNKGKEWGLGDSMLFGAFKRALRIHNSK